jgi:hypothetical protein
MKAKAFGLAACVALACAASAPAEAQFMSNYPVLVVPPPQAQTLVMPPKPSTPKPAPPKPAASAQPPPTPSTPPGCYYQGQTRVCP